MTLRDSFARHILSFSLISISSFSIVGEWSISSLRSLACRFIPKTSGVFQPQPCATDPPDSCSPRHTSHISLLLPSLSPSKMKLVASTKQFTMRFVQKHVIPPVAARYLGSPVHPIRPKIHHLYANRDRDTLWWRVSVKQVQRYKRVVRSWCARRARTAFQQALKDRGYDADGRRIQRESESSEPGDTTQGKEGNLMGSLDITVLPPTVQESFSTVQSDMHSLLDALIEQNNQKNNQRQKSRNNNKNKAQS